MPRATKRPRIETDVQWRVGISDGLGFIVQKFGKPVSHLRKVGIARYDLTWPKTSPVMTYWTGSRILKVYHDEGNATQCFHLADVKERAKAKRHVARCVKPNDQAKRPEAI